MKVLFTADLHINLHRKNIPYNWALSRYFALFEQLLSLIKEKHIDVCVLGGDIFDKKPDFDELELYFELISSLPVNTIIYDGNHEATKKGKTFFKYLQAVTNKVNPLVSVVDTICRVHGMDVLPYCKLHEIDSKKHKTSNILVTHVRGNIEPHVKSEIDLDRLKDWEIVLAGDLHNHNNSQRNIVYPGSPVTTNFHRNEVETGVVILDTDTLTYYFHKLSLPQLIRKRVESSADIVATNFHHTIYEVEGNIADLAKVRDSTLIDKKIVKRKFTSMLNLKDMTLEEEIQQYAKAILKLNDTDIQRLIEKHKEIYTT